MPEHLTPLILAVVLAASHQEGPPTPVHYLPPSAGRIEASYACVGREPQIRTSYTLELDYERVRITAYSGPNGVATAEQLAEWNEGLQPIRSVQVHRFDCRRDGERLVIRGVDRDGGGDVGLMITARGGEMQSMPLGQDQPED